MYRKTISDVVEVFRCPACSGELNLQSGTLSCMSCDYKSKMQDNWVPDLVYTGEIEKYTDKVIDIEYVPDDLSVFKKKYGSFQGFQEHLNQELILLKQAHNELSILDVGSYLFDDVVFKPFAEEIRHHVDSYVGIDPSKAFFKRQSPIEGFNVARAFGEYLPILSASVNCVLCIATMDHMFDAERFLAEAKRVLKSRGILVIHLNNDGSWFKKLLKKRAQKCRENAKESHNYFWNVPEMRRLIEENGFQVLRYGGFRYLPILGNTKLTRRLFEYHTIEYHTYVAIATMIDRILNRVAKDYGGDFWLIAMKPDDD